MPLRWYHSLEATFEHRAVDGALIMGGGGGRGREGEGGRGRGREGEGGGGRYHIDKRC